MAYKKVGFGAQVKVYIVTILIFQPDLAYKKVVFGAQVKVYIVHI